MVHPLSSVQEQINRFFPPKHHPYRRLEAMISERMRPSSRVLDIGCGRGAPVLSTFIGACAELHGIDLVDFTDEAGGDGLQLSKQSIDDMSGFLDERFDIAYSRSVMEHVENPRKAFAEVHRVLEPGGCYIFLTPNRYDYASLISTVVPNALHGAIVRNTEGRDVEDTFPTFYRSNSFTAIREHAAAAGLRVAHLSRLNQYPNYLTFNRVLFYLGCMYEKLLESAAFLDPLKGWIICVLEKPPTDQRVDQRVG